METKLSHFLHEAFQRLKYINIHNNGSMGKVARYMYKEKFTSQSLLHQRMLFLATVRVFNSYTEKIVLQMEQQVLDLP